MNCDCSIDTDDCALLELFTSDTVIARKIHKCCECHQEIKPGERYERVTGKWDGEFSTINTCLVCSQIRRDYCPHGYEFGGLKETLWECLGVDYITGKVRED